MKTKPPQKALDFLRWFCRKDYIEEVEGDLTELFEKEHNSSPVKAQLRFIWSVFRYFRPQFIKSFKPDSPLNSMVMFRHNLMLSYRKSMRYKSTFLINLVGLSIGLASSIMILLWVNYELSVDKFHEKDEQLYQIIRNVSHPDGIKTYGNSPALLANVLASEMPEIEYAVTVNSDEIRPRGILSNKDTRIQTHGLYASSDFFRIFSYPLIQGNSETALVDKNAIVISDKLAIKLFGGLENVIGKILEGNRDLLNETFVISGIFESPPLNSTKQFDFVINYETVLKHFAWNNEWTADEAKTYFTLKKSTNVAHFNTKIQNLLKSKANRLNNSLFAQQYSQKYLYGKYENGIPVAGRMIYIRLFSIVALFILAIACINFMNLSTAQASRKMKEIGVKKAIGADRKALISQFLLEATFITSLSMLFAFLLVELLLPQFNEIIGKTLSITYDTNLIFTILGITLILGILAGSYPAFYLSGFNPVTVLKGKLNRSLGEQWIRKGFVITQFTISVIFITSFLVIHKQIEFVQTKDLGYNRENVIHFQIRGTQNRETLLQTLKNIPGVINTTNIFGGSSIVNMRGAGRGFSWDGKTPDQDIVFLRPHIGYDFVETLGIELIEGRTFSREYGDESSKLIINKAAAEMIGLDNIVGQAIMDGDIEKEIIGVVKNFNIKSLHEEMRPTIMRFSPNGRDIMIKIGSENEREIITKIENVYNQFSPEYPFTFTFIDDDYQAQYIFEERIAVLSRYFTSIAIIISCLGLFGLAAFTVEKRLKEMGIRKVLGASDLNIVRLLSGDFTKLVLVAITIALPLGYLLSSMWLESFAYRIDLEWWIFVSSGIGAMLITWLTIGLQTIKAAGVEPVRYLKSE